MTKEEFEIITRGSLDEAIARASLYLRMVVPKGDIRLVVNEKVIAEGWDRSVDFLVGNMYVDENHIKPCSDLIVDDFDENTTTIRVHISEHEPRAFTLNWSGGIGPYIKGINMKLIEERANREFPSDWGIST